VAAMFGAGRLERTILALVILTAIVLIPYLVPNRGNETGAVFGGREDRGTFVSVAASLNAGSTLYSEVYDNKDPLFYYAVAAQLRLGSWAQLGFEVLMVVIACWSAFLLLRDRAPLATRLLVAGVGVPLILTGAFYIQGATHLPGTALALAAIASAAHRRAAPAGALVALLAMTKLIAAPVAVAGAIPFFVGRPLRAWAVAIASGVGVTLAVIAILAARGELQAYLDVQLGNILYSQNALMDGRTGLSAVMQHLWLVGEGGRGHTAVVAIVLAVSASLIATRSSANAGDAKLAVAALAALVAAMLVLAMTGIWHHHNQLLYIPAVIAICCLGRLIAHSINLAPMPAITACLCVALLLGGAPAPLSTLDGLRNSWQQFPVAYASLSAPAPGGRTLLKAGPTGRYARLGENYDDMGFALGIDGWRLACPRFHQYFFQTEAVLASVLDCIDGVPTLLIAESLQVSNAPGVTEDWKQFVARVEDKLSREYVCDAPAGLRVCSLRKPP
jgi:hypothetical protein